MTAFKWSQTAADNDDIDSTINFQEGQSPGSLNNSTRAVMAAIAKKRDDDSGLLTTAGTSTAYTVTTNQVFTALTDGISVVVRLDETCGTDPTFSPDSLTAKNISYDGTTNVPSGSLLGGGIYKLTYRSSPDKWIVEGYLGGVMLTGANPDLVAIEALAGTTGGLTKTAANTWALDNFTTALEFEKDNAGVVFSTGIAGDIHIPFACTITGVFLYVDQTGSIVLDLWKDTHANFPPNNSDSITASAQPTISSATKYSDTTLTGWNTAIAAGDIIRVNIDSVSTVTRFLLSIRVKRFA